MRSVRRLLDPHLAPALGLHNSEVTPVESEAEDVVEVPIDKDTTGNEVAVHDFDPQKYKREEVWLTVLKLNDVKSPLRADFQIHEEKSMESPRTSK